MDCATTIETAETIHGWMTRQELRWLFQQARAQPQGATWVELGTWKGRSFFTVAMGLRRGSRLVAIDTFTPEVASLPFVPTCDWVSDHFEAVLSAVRRLRSDLQVDVMRQDTSEASQLFAVDSVDVVFCDADHSREGLERDLNAWLPKISPGGLVAGHDYSNGFPALMQLVDERFPERVIEPDTSIWYARKLR